MKCLLSIFLILILAVSGNAQSSYYKEWNYNNFLGEWRHHGDVIMTISLLGEIFLITIDIPFVGMETYRGYPTNGLIEYRDNSGNSQYIKFSQDYDNLLLQGYYEYKYASMKEVKPRVLPMTDARMIQLERYIGHWKGSSNSDEIRESVIHVAEDGKIIYDDLTNVKNCELVLLNSGKLFGLIELSDSFTERFELYFEENNLVYNSYYTTIYFAERVD